MIDTADSGDSTTAKPDLAGPIRAESFPTTGGTPRPTPATSPSYPEDSPGPTPGDNALITLAEAAELVGVSVSALRKRYRAGDLERHYDEGGRVLLDLEAVRRLYPATEQSGETAALVTGEMGTALDPEVEGRAVPPGSVMVPLDAWTQVLAQLGNLHQAGQELAEARERAARAEERERFAQERRREAEAEVERLRKELETPDKEIEAEDRLRSRPRRWWQRGS